MILSRFAGDLPVHLGDAGCEPKQVAPAPPTPSRPGSGPPMRQARYRPRPQPAARRRERTTPPPARPRTRGPAVGSDPISGPRDPGCRPRRSRGSPTPYRAWQSRPPAKRSAPWCSMTGSRGRPGATRSCRTSRPASGSAPTREAPPADLAGPRNRRPGHPHRLRGRPGELRRCRHRRVPGCGRAAVRGPLIRNPPPRGRQTQRPARPPRRGPAQGPRRDVAYPGKATTSQVNTVIQNHLHIWVYRLTPGQCWGQHLGGVACADVIACLGGPGIPRALGAMYGQVIGRRSRSGPRRWLRARASRRSRRRPCGRRRGSRRR